jgi:uncharacterized protein DUF6607
MRKITYLTACILLAVNVSAQQKTGQQSVRSLCGCFEVEFKYAETFAPDTAYKFHPRYHASGLEWVVPEEATDKKFVLQHLLIIDDTTTIKHWREDWEFEKYDRWAFDHDATWKHITGDKLNEKGHWIQTVWEVDDAPRYQGSSVWLSNNNKNYWENTTDAPLPRREYSKRNDYNVLQRTNRIIITDTGWIHEQDNKKIIRNDSVSDKLLAEEKGYNIYRRTSDSKCLKASAWWQDHKSFWKTVREEWDAAMKDKNNIHLLAKIDGKYLYQQIDELENQPMTNAKLKEKLKSIFNQYIATKGIATKGETPTTAKY